MSPYSAQHLAETAEIVQKLDQETLEVFQFSRLGKVKFGLPFFTRQSALFKIGPL